MRSLEIGHPHVVRETGLVGLLVAVVPTLGCHSEPPQPEPVPRVSQPTSSETATATQAPDTRPPAISGPQIRVLGTAQDGGLPHAACTCPRCEAARTDPARRRLVASIAIVLPDRGEAYLVDATPDIRPQLHALRDVGPTATGRTDRRPVDGVFISHAHLGHYTGLAFLGFEAIHTDEVPVYATPAMAGFLRKNAPWDQLVRLENITLKELAPGVQRTLGAVSVTPIKVPHRDEYADTVGYRLRGPTRTVLYVPDTDPWGKWPAPVTDALQGVDTAILDGTFFSADELPGRDLSRIGHPLIVDTMDLLEDRVKSGTLAVYFTHLNHSNPALEPTSEARTTIEARGFHLLEDGQTLAL